MAKGPFRLAGISLATILAATVVAGCGSLKGQAPVGGDEHFGTASSLHHGPVGGGGSGAVTDLSSYTKGGSGAANNSLSPG